MDDLEIRAARHAALGDPVRLRIVDQLSVSDRSPLELRRLVGIESNLLAHHLDVLDEVGLITRSRSSGDGRRRYVRLRGDLIDATSDRPKVRAQRALFVCTANSARSQLAAALWAELTGSIGESAGTHPAARVHEGAVAAARRAGLDIATAVPRELRSVRRTPALVVTVCDRAHEELDAPPGWLHWSVSDPVPDPAMSSSTRSSARSFDAAVAELTERIRSVVGRAA